MAYKLTLLSRFNGTQTFTEDCLKEFVAKNKTLESPIGLITNIRYENDKVYGDVDIILQSTINMYILSRLETPTGAMITDFKPIDVTIKIAKGKIK